MRASEHLSRENRRRKTLHRTLRGMLVQSKLLEQAPLVRVTIGLAEVRVATCSSVVQGRILCSAGLYEFRLFAGFSLACRVCPDAT